MRKEKEEAEDEEQKTAAGPEIEESSELEEQKE